MRILILLGVLLTQSTAQVSTGSVSGRIQLTNGNPPPQPVRVAAMTMVEPGAPARETGALLSIAMTDGSGSFRLEDVPPGRYYVVAGPINSATYYPGVTQPAEARVITVIAGASITGIDFRMNSSPRAGALTQIQGILINTGKPLPTRPNIQVQRANGITGTSADSDGRFRLFLDNGEYQFHVVNLSPRHTVRSISFGSVDLLNSPLRVDGTPLPEIRVTIEEVALSGAFKISGRIANMPGPSFVRSPMIRLRSETAARNDLTANRDLPMKADGTFEIEDVLPGAYLVIPLGSPMSGVTGTRVVVTDQDVRDVIVRLPVHAEVTTRIVVEDANGDVMVGAIGLDAIRMSYSSARAQGGGTARHLMMAPGEYTITFSGWSSDYEVLFVTTGETDLTKNALIIPSLPTPVEIVLRLRYKKR